MKVLGIDVGIRVSHYVLISDGRVVEKGELGRLDFEGVEFAGIDAPLSFPQEGNLRECEKELYRMGIRLFPSGAKFFRPVAVRGIEIAKALEKKSIKVFEVYPYATRKILGIAPDSKKNVRSGLERIKAELRKYIEFEDLENSDLVDACIAALTVDLYRKGKARFVSGKDGKILIPI